MANTNDWNFTFDEPVPKFLDLPNGVMERICQYLPTQSDKSQACLIHKTWHHAAMNVLWSAPRFRLPNNLKVFVKTIKTSKKLALLVRDIYLVFPDNTTSVFLPAAKSNMERHRGSNSLTSQDLITVVVKACEKLTTLTIYGWEVDVRFIETLGFMATSLTGLHIIGANTKHNTLHIHSLLSRLTSLSLDGRFKLNDTFISQLVNRANQLTHLQLSLSELDRSTLKKICSKPSHLQLQKLALTDAYNIHDSDVKEVVKAFPELKSLCIEGAVQLTDLSVFYAVSVCLGLQELDIRCHHMALDNPTNPIKVSFQSPPSHVVINLQRLVLENILYDDSVFECLANNLGKLKLIGLKSCPNITSRTLDALIMSCDKLQAIYISHCPEIGLGIFTELREVTTAASASLTTFHIDHSGRTTPACVYHLCVSNPKLRTLSIEGYPNINDSVIGTFNTLNPQRATPEENDLVVLDQKSIDALVNAPEFSYSGESRTLSGYQISLLADELKMRYQDLLSLMDEVASRENNIHSNNGGRNSRQSNGRNSIQSNGRISAQMNHINGSSSARPNGISPRSSVDLKGKKSLNRMSALKTEALRPDTPSLWSHDYAKNGQDFLGAGHTPTSSNDTNSSGNFNKREYDDDDDEDEEEDEEEGGYGGSNGSDSENRYNEEDSEDEDEDDDDENEDEDDNRNTYYYSNGNQANSSSNQNMNGTSHVEDWSKLTGQNDFSGVALGGWGEKMPEATQKHSSSTELTTRSINQLDKSFPDQSNKDYVNKWREKSTEETQNTRRQLNHSQNEGEADSDGDGWGKAKTFVAWNDLRRQGYNADLIDEQKRTPFWRGAGDKWDKLPTGEEMEAAQLEQENLSAQQAKASSTVTFDSLLIKKTSYRKRSDSCVSSTGSINLDKGADVILKTSSDQIGLSNSYRGSSIAEQPKAKPSPVDWRTARESVDQEDQRNSSRREFTNETTYNDGATNGWSDLAKSTAVSKGRFSRTVRGSSSRKPTLREREHIPPEQMPGRWGAFQQATNQIAPTPTAPITSSSSSARPVSQAETPPPTKSYTPEPLIQTFEPASRTPEPATEDLLVDTSDIIKTVPLRPSSTSFNNSIWNDAITTSTASTTTANTNNNNNNNNNNTSLMDEASPYNNTVAMADIHKPEKPNAITTLSPLSSPARVQTPVRTTTPVQPSTSTQALTPTRALTPERALTPARASTPLIAPEPSSPLDADVYRWPSEDSDLISDRPFFAQHIVGTGHDEPEPVNEFDRLVGSVSSYNNKSSNGDQKSQNGYLDDMSQLMSPLPEPALIETFTSPQVSTTTPNGHTQNGTISNNTINGNGLNVNNNTNNNNNNRNNNSSSSSSNMNGNGNASSSSGIINGNNSIFDTDIDNNLLLSNSILNNVDNGTDVSSIGSSPAPTNDGNDEIFSTSLSIETKQFGEQKIYLDENSDIPAVVEEFCNKYDMANLTDRILGYVQQIYVKRKTKKLFKKTKKKSSSTAPSPSLN